MEEKQKLGLEYQSDLKKYYLSKAYKENRAEMLTAVEGETLKRASASQFVVSSSTFTVQPLPRDALFPNSPPHRRSGGTSEAYC